MAVVNLTPVLDALGGAVATPARFTATAMRAGRTAVRVNSGTVTFPTDLTAEWDGAGWDAPPQLHLLPADCYWKVRVAAAGNRLERNVILPDSGDRVDFGDLIPITPDTGQPDNGALAQYQATQQYVANQVAQVTATAATVFNQVATVQAQISTSAQQVQQASNALALVQTAQTAIDADVIAVITAATQTALDRAAVAADRTAADTDAAAAAADRAAAETAQTAAEAAQAAAEAAQTAAETAQAAAEAAAAVYTTTTTIDGNA